MPLLAAPVKADTITLTVPGNTGAWHTNSYNVPSNVVAQVVSVYSPGGCLSTAIYVTFGSQPGASAYYQVLGSYQMNWNVQNAPIIVGPATIALVSSNTCSAGVPNYLAYCTIQTTSAASFTPSTAVVIPNDGAGPVTIILESSVDLINWTAALPGTYGTSSSNRFFRVRAQR